jgi:WD40 repeat protein
MRESNAGDFTLERLEEAGLRSGPALFSGDGSRFALPHADGLLIWNAAETATTPRLLTTSGYPGKFSQDGAVLATAGFSPASKGLEIWRPDANRLAGGQALDLEGDLMKTAGFLEDGRVFQATLDGAVRVWRRDGGKWTPGPVVASTDDYRDFAEGAGLTLAIASDDRLIIAREGKDGWTKDELPAERIRRGAVSPDGAAIVTRGAGDRLQLWTQQDGKWVAETLADSGATDAAVAGGGDRVVSIEREGDGAVVVLRTRSKAGAWARQILGGQLPSGIGRIDISRDGRRIAAGGPGGDIWLWSLTRAEDWAEERIVIPSNSVRLSPDGSALATTHEDGWVRVWTVREDGKWVGTPVGDPDDRAQDARFSPDGQMLVVRRAGEGMRLIDIAWLGLAGAEGRGDLELLSAEVCASKLPPSAGSNLRRISSEDVAAAPMLAGREGEDVCAWRPAWYDRVLDFLFGWTG